MSESRISLAETRHVAALSKLHFEEDELESLNAEMAAILETVSLMQRVPLDGLEATLGVGSYANRFREDQTAPTLAVGDALSNAPAHRDGCFEIVRILSKTSEE